MSTPEKTVWPRIRDLPEAERELFLKFLTGHSVPWIEGESMKDQDGYFEQDYVRFKSFQRKA